MTTAYTSLLGLALPVTGELSGTWGDTVNTAITSLLDTAIAGTTSITTDADITLSTTTGASNQARQAIILWNPASGTTTRNITAPAQSKMYTVINASGGTQSIVIRGAGPTTGVTVLKGESALVAWNGSDFVKVSSVGGAGTFTNLTVTGNTILGDAIGDTLTVNATTSFTAPVNLPSTGRSAAAALTPTNPAFLYGVASTYTDTTSSGTLAPVATFYSLARPTLSTSNVTTYTNAATLYIANSPAAGGSATITNPYAMYIAAGNMYFGGSVASNLLFVDNTYDIGASGATRPRTLYLGTSLITPAITNSGLTAGRVTYAGAGGLLTDSANLQFDGTNFSIGIAPSAGVQLYVYAPASTNAEVRIAVPTATQATYTSYVNTTVTKVGTENSAGGALASGSSAYATVISNNGGYPVQVGTNNVIRTTVDSSGNFGVGITSPAYQIDVGGGTTVSRRIQLRRGSDDTSQNMLIGWNGIDVLRNVSIASAQTNFTINQVASDATRNTFTINSDGGATFNEDGYDSDFRIESDGNTSMLFVDGGNNRVVIGASQYGVSTTAFQASNMALTDTGGAHHLLMGNQDSGGVNSPSIIRGVNGVLNLGWGDSWTSATGGTITIGLSVDKGSSTVVVNEDGADIDFRVESDGNANMLFVDAGNNVVSIGTSTVPNWYDDSVLQSNTWALSQLLGADQAAYSSGSYQDAYGYTTNWKFKGNYPATLYTQTGDHTFFVTTSTRGANNAISWKNVLAMGDSSVVVNEDTNDIDFRVESDTNTHALFVDAGNSRVGVNNSNPSVPLDVTGIIRAGYQLDQSSPVQNTWYNIIASMVDNSAYQVALFAIKGSNEEFAIYQSLQVVGSLNSSTRTAYYIVGSGSGLEYRVLNNFPSPNSLQVRVTASGVSALRASVLQMGG